MIQIDDSGASFYINPKHIVLIDMQNTDRDSDSIYVCIDIYLQVIEKGRLNPFSIQVDSIDEGNALIYKMLGTTEKILLLDCETKPGKIYRHIKN